MLHIILTNRFWSLKAWCNPPVSAAKTDGEKTPHSKIQKSKNKANYSSDTVGEQEFVQMRYYSGIKQWVTKIKWSIIYNKPTQKSQTSLKPVSVVSNKVRCITECNQIPSEKQIYKKRSPIRSSIKSNVDQQTTIEIQPDTQEMHTKTTVWG